MPFHNLVFVLPFLATWKPLLLFYCLKNDWSFKTLTFQHLPPSSQPPFFSVLPLSFYSSLYHNSLIYYNYLLTYLSLSSRKGNICLSHLNTWHSDSKSSVESTSTTQISILQLPGYISLSKLTSSFLKWYNYS